ncbi:MAG: dihydropteroate synthase [Candidatus Zixiibacteriota bacterium]
MHKIWKCRDKSISLGQKTIIMGILNTTPDSFSDGGKFNSHDSARKRIEEMLEEGADIIDIGGESSRPFAEPVPKDIELERVIPIIEEFGGSCIISIDTYKPSVAKEAMEAGAKIINDITGFRNPSMANIAVEFDAGVVIMHMLGNPQSMQKNPKYDNVTKEILSYLVKQSRMLIDEGLDSKNIAIDPGIGFGKTVGDNFEILRNLSSFTKAGYPVLLGASRKSFMKAAGLEDVSQRLEGSIASAAIGIVNGASILRVHDIIETAQAARIADAIRYGI